MNMSRQKAEGYRQKWILNFGGGEAFGEGAKWRGAGRLVATVGRREVKLCLGWKRTVLAHRNRKDRAM